MCGGGGGGGSTGRWMLKHLRTSWIIKQPHIEIFTLSHQIIFKTWDLGSRFWGKKMENGDTEDRNNSSAKSVSCTKMQSLKVPFFVSCPPLAVVFPSSSSSSESGLRLKSELFRNTTCYPHITHVWEGHSRDDRTPSAFLWYEGQKN